MKTQLQGITLGIAFAAVTTGTRALLGGDELLLVAWWMIPAFAFGFWMAKS